MSYPTYNYCDSDNVELTAGLEDNHTAIYNTRSHTLYYFPGHNPNEVAPNVTRAEAEYIISVWEQALWDSEDLLPSEEILVNEIGLTTQENDWPNYDAKTGVTL